MTPLIGAKEFAEITLTKTKHQHMQGLGQPQTPAGTESEFIIETRKLDHATEQLKELLIQLVARTEPIRVAIPTLDSPNIKEPRPEPKLSSLGFFLRSQSEKVKEACILVETLLSEMRI